MKVRLAFFSILLFLLLTVIYIVQEAMILYGAVTSIKKGKVTEEMYWRAAKEANLPYDTRSPLQVIEDSRTTEKPLKPVLAPYYFYDEVVELNWEGQKRVVFGGEPLIEGVVCGETGSILSHLYDEFGFLNPRGIYEKRPIDLLLLGDSTVEGNCVPRGGSLGDYARLKLPKTLSMGQRSNGPLSALGAIKEFVPFLKPRYVLWFHVEGNDVWELIQEAANPLSAQFLKEDYKPWQWENWSKVVKALPALSDQVFHSSKKASSQPFSQRLKGSHPSIAAFLHLHPLRNTLFPQFSFRPQVVVDDRHTTALLQAKALIKQQGGKLVVVMVPNWDNLEAKRKDPSRDLFLEALAKNKIPVVDLVPWISSIEDPLSLYNFRLRAHWTPETNEKVMNRILESLPMLGL